MSEERWFTVTVRASAAARRAVSAAWLRGGASAVLDAVSDGREAGVLTSAAGPAGAAELVRAALVAAGDAALSLSLEPVDDRAWATSWIDAIAPRPLGARFVAAAARVEDEPRLARELAGTGRHVLWLEPALAFGYGEHPTTALVADALERRVAAQPGATVLDVGTGTGVLAILAAAAGAGRVDAVDVSAEARAAARRAAARNGVAERCRVLDGALAELEGSYNVVVANVEPRPLLELLPDAIARVADGGSLVLSGFLEEHWGAVTARLAGFGFVVTERGERDGWQLAVAARG